MEGINRIATGALLVLAAVAPLAAGQGTVLLQNDFNQYSGPPKPWDVEADFPRGTQKTPNALAGRAMAGGLLYSKGVTPADGGRAMVGSFPGAEGGALQVTHPGGTSASLSAHAHADSAHVTAP
jgi:hypothetical protein